MTADYRAIIGCRYGRLTVISQYRAGERSEWTCRCDCGAVAIVRRSNLVSGNTRSCGCLQRELRGTHNLKHGRSNSSAYWRWKAMIQRCTNPKAKSYSNYGGRGIRVCERWRDFQAFYADMGEPPPGGTIERLNNNGDYCPENCIWASQSEQNRNQRRTVILTHAGVTKPLIAWAEELGVHYILIHNRLKRGWSVERAVTTPGRLA